MKTLTYRSLIAGVTVVTLAFGATGTAAATKPKPPEQTQYYTVTLSGDLSTEDGTCTVETALVMREEDGHLVADGTLGTSTPRLTLEASVPWSREYPVPTGDSSGFHGCHGGLWPDPGSDPAGYLWIYREGETITGVMWAFDWYTGTIPGPGKKPKPQQVQEYFRAWNVKSLTIGAPTTFLITYYGPSTATGLGTTDLTIDIGIAPIPG